MTINTIALTALATTFAIGIITRVYSVFFDSIKKKEPNIHSEKYIPGRGWAIIDGEFVEL